MIAILCRYVYDLCFQYVVGMANILKYKSCGEHLVLVAFPDVSNARKHDAGLEFDMSVPSSECLSMQFPVFRIYANLKR
jgi:hypothetical protein